MAETRTRSNEMRSKTVTRTLKYSLPMALAVALSVNLAAQDGQPSTPPPASRPASPAQVGLKVSLIFSRLQGDKKVSSLPYTVFVTANDQRTSLRLGTQIPVPTTTITDKGSVPSYNYRDVGTNIDCAASSAPDGAYKLTITITDSSVYYPDESDAATRSTTAVTRAPAFRNFNSTFTLLVRDGQTVQSTSVTDPVSGQTIKVDATLNVQK
jgi:type II secretory pathway component GspD/PulD (secretin)